MKWPLSEDPITDAFVDKWFPVFSKVPSTSNNNNRLSQAWHNGYEAAMNEIKNKDISSTMPCYCAALQQKRKCRPCAVRKETLDNDEFASAKFKIKMTTEDIEGSS